VKITAQTTDETATIAMTRAEALVFFEFLSRFDQDEQLDIRDKAEELVLWHIQGAFERVLAEPFAQDYREKLERAREAVRDSALDRPA
jgi:hypothetical protein